MAYNVLTGTIMTPPSTQIIPYEVSSPAIISGNLSTSDGSSVINVPRVSNATNNAILTNVNGDANSLICEGNFTFDGSTANITGHLTASSAISASVFYGDGSKLTGVVTGSSTSDTMTVRGVGSGNNTLSAGFNYATTTFDSPAIWSLPTNLSVGDVVRVKVGAGVSAANYLTIAGQGGHTIDGVASVRLESPFGAVSLIYVASGSYRIF